MTEELNQTNNDDNKFLMEVFGNPVMTLDTPIDEEWRQELLKYIDKTSPLDSNRTYFTDDTPVTFDFDITPLLSAINKAVREYLSVYVKEDKMKYYDFHVVKWWSVLMTNDGVVSPHTHTDGHISGVYYAEANDFDTGCLSILDDSAGTTLPFGFPIHGRHLHGPYRYDIPAKTNSLVLFPSKVCHAVLPYNGVKKRYSVSFDIIITRNNEPDDECDGAFENTLPEPKFWKKLT